MIRAMQRDASTHGLRQVGTQDAARSDQRSPVNGKRRVATVQRDNLGAPGVDNVRDQNAYAQDDEKTHEPGTHVHLQTGSEP